MCVSCLTSCECSQTRIVASCMLTFVINSFIAQITNPLYCVSYLLIAFGRLPNQVKLNPTRV